MWLVAFWVESVLAKRGPKDFAIRDSGRHKFCKPSFVIWINPQEFQRHCIERHKDAGLD